MIEKRFQDILQRLYADGDKYRWQESLYRGEILALMPDVMGHVLKEACEDRAAPILELLVKLLAETHYPPALPHFVRWLYHPDPDIRLTAAKAIDVAAKKRFAVDTIKTDNGEALQKLIPQLRAWWETTGQNEAIDLEAWRAKHTTKPTYTQRERWFNFVTINRRWALLGNDIFLRPRAKLPRQQGIHLVGATAHFPVTKRSHAAAVEIDSDTGKILAINIKDHTGRWRNIAADSPELKLNFLLEDAPESPTVTPTEGQPAPQAETPPSSLPEMPAALKVSLTETPIPTTTSPHPTAPLSPPPPPPRPKPPFPLPIPSQPLIETSPAPSSDDPPRPAPDSPKPTPSGPDG